MTKTRFDYKAACAEVSQPLARALPVEVLEVYRYMRDDPATEDLRQGRDLCIPINEELRRRFEALETGALSFAAQVINDCGSFSGTVDQGKQDTRGAYWKFSNVADQILLERLKLPARNATAPNGLSFKVYEGALRVCASGFDFWTWEEVGPATPEALQFARELAKQYAATDLFNRPKAIRDAMRPTLSPEWIAVLSVGETYTREEGKCSDDCPECGKTALWTSERANHARTCSKYPLVEDLSECAEKAIRSLQEAAQKRGQPGAVAALLAKFQEVKP